MRYFLLLSFVFLFSSCFNRESDVPVVTIDLNKKVSQILYSSFVDSLHYVTLSLPDSLVLSGVERLYIDGDDLLIQDERLGLFVFSLKKHTLMKVIDYFGNGPGEFNSIRTFTFDPNKKQLLVYSYPYLHKYTYDGTFVESIKNERFNVIDIHGTNTGNYICIAPEEVGPDAPNGVWLTDSALQFIKILKEIPPEQKLFTRSTFYNRAENGIYYYDRVWDDFSFITDTSVDMMYKFNLKQRVPEKMRRRENPLSELKEYSFINEFANSDRYILLNYFQFNSDDISWVLLDKADHKVVSSGELQNDMSDIHISSSKLFYINNQTWCRIIDFGENDTTITLEFMYIKQP